jgi:hypothetical protein
VLRGSVRGSMRRIELTRSDVAREREFILRSNIKWADKIDAIFGVLISAQVTPFQHLKN